MGVRRGSAPLAFVALTLACSSRSAEVEVATPVAPESPLAAFEALSKALASAAPLERSDRGFEVRHVTRDGVFARPTGALRITLPDRADGAMRVSSFADPQLFVDVRVRSGSSAPARLEGNALRMHDAATGVEEVFFASHLRAEEVRVLPKAERVELAWELRKGPSVSTLRLAGDDVIEALDREGRPRLRTEPMFAVDARGTRRALHLVLGGSSIVTARAILDARDLVAPIAVDPAWVAAAGTLPFATSSGAVVTLSSGKLLYAGGSNSGASESVNAATYDPATDTWKAVGSMKAGRRNHAMLTLPSGQVLAVAGWTGSSTAEKYDPATETWSFVSPMAYSRGMPIGALLPSGKVAVVGGSISTTGKPLPIEIYDPATDTWTSGKPPFTAFAGGGALVLPSGKVVFADTDRAETYDPATNTWTLGSAPAFPHTSAEFVPLSGALYAIGSYQSSTTRNAEIERFDPATNTWSYVGRTTVLPNTAVHAVALSTGKIFSVPSTTTSNLFDPVTGVSIAAGRPTLARTGASLAKLPGDKVLLIGGDNSAAGGYVSTAEIWSMPTASNGTTCTVGDDCASLHCVDGVCCDSACTGECSSCALAGKLGTCSPVASGDDPHGVCAGDCALGCKAGVCTYSPKGSACGTDGCSKGKLETGACTGYDDSCVSTVTACPGGLLCQDATSCKKGCTSGADCASGPCDLVTGTCTDYAFETGPDAGPEPSPETGPVDTGVVVDTGAPEDTGVDATEDASVVDTGAPDTASEDTAPAIDAVAPRPENDGGVPVAPPPSEVLRCATGAECPTGFCSDGVCCDRPCNERCHSCALPGSLGRCTASPAGVDLRNECGAPLDCVGTCDGRGYCTGASKGTQCARAQCTGPSKGVGPAYCSAPGVRCPTFTTEPFECAPFACDPVFGACHSRCASSDQCASGYVCDVGAQLCVAPAIPEESGCSVASTPGRSASRFSGLFLFAAVFALRRRSLFAWIASALSIGCSAKSESKVQPPADGARAVLATLRGFDEIGARLLPGGALERHGEGLRVAGARHGAGFRPAGHAALDVVLPATSDGATRISVPRDPEVWIAIVPEGDRAVAGVAVERALVHEKVAPDTDVVLFADRDRFEDLRLLRSPSAPVVTKYRIDFGAGVSTLRLAEGRVEVLDGAGKVRFHSEPAFAVDAHGERRALRTSLEIHGRTATLVTELDPGGLAYPIAVDPTFTAIANPSAAHNRGHGALIGGKAVFVGGHGTDVHGVVESYDAATDTWKTLAPMLEPRELFAMAKLPSGRLVVAGGQNGPSGGLSTAETYDPVTDTWTAIAPMAFRRGGTDGVLLGDGRVLVAGGGYSCGLFCGALYSSAETYDPGTNTWSAAGAMQIPRSEPRLHVLGGGKVLAVHDRGNTRTQVDLFDPSTSTWSAAAPMPVGRREHLSARLASGKVALFGGAFAGVRTDVYDVATNTWTQVADGVASHNDGVAALLPDGRMLIAGDGSTAELYDETADTFAKAGSTSTNLTLAPAVVLPSGQVVFAGSGVVMAQLWSPPVALGLACVEDGDCISGHCVDGVCCSVASCATGSSCATSSALGVCRKLAGQTCTAASECGSGFCVDGVCCATACTGACRSCRLSTSRGVCTNVDEGADPHGACPDGPCGACKAGACVRKAAGSTCGTSCSGSTVTHGTCRTDGVCENVSEPCPGALVCADTTSCRSYCSTAADCTTGACSTSGSCELTAAPDAAPADSGDAGSADAADATAIDGGSDEGVDSSPTDTGVVTVDSSLDDTLASDTSVAPPDTAVEDTATVSDSASDATAPDVDVAAPKLDGDTPRLPVSIQRCMRDDECPTGHCADGVCCDTACGDRCHSCAQLDSPGVCKALPAGVDLRGECGPIGTCVATCDGKGACVGAGTGTQCAQQRCTGKSTGVGPAYCAGKGAPCPVGDGVKFECAPYVCEPLFGACTTTCTKTDECAVGFVCDVAAKQCVPAPAPAQDEGGCSASRAPARESSGVAAIGVVLALAALRRSRGGPPTR